MKNYPKAQLLLNTNQFYASMCLITFKLSKAKFLSALSNIKIKPSRTLRHTRAFAVKNLLCLLCFEIRPNLRCEASVPSAYQTH